MSGEFHPESVQGNILRGYKRDRVRHLVLEVTDREAARRFLAASVDETGGAAPRITSESRRKWHATENPKPAAAFNIGVTFEGLRALGASSQTLATFPSEFAEGMAKRAVKLGDVGDSAPETWSKPFDQPARVHLIASIHFDDTTPEAVVREMEQAVGRAFHVLGARDGRNLAEGKVFFGFRDSISQPRFEHIHDRDRFGDDAPIDPLGTVLLGHPTRFEGLVFRVPEPEELGRDGTFNAFRVLAQEVRAFEEYLDEAADQLLARPDAEALLAPGQEERIGAGLGRRGAFREIVAAQMCGRWRNGRPVATFPDSQAPDLEPGDARWSEFLSFDYDEASGCPAGSHMRRCNPRGGPIVQRIANNTRRLVRRGMSYGPDFDHANPDDRERGLLGSFIGANLGAQFEAVMCDWVNVGLQHPEITGSNDPMIGANTRETSWFDLRLNGRKVRLRGFPRFVTTRGGAYAFLPSLPAIRRLSQLTA